MTITDRNLQPETRVAAKYKGTVYEATVEDVGEKGMAVVLADGRRFKSLSAAGSAVMGGSACNGWRFWSVAGAAPPASTTAATSTATAPPVRKQKAYNPIRRVANQRGLASETDARWWCDGCGAPSSRRGSRSRRSARQGTRSSSYADLRRQASRPPRWRPLRFNAITTE